MKHNEVHLLPAGQNLRPLKLEAPGMVLYPAFGTYGVLKKVGESGPEKYYEALWDKAAEVPVWIGSCKFSDPLDDVMQSFSVTKFGGARVTNRGSEALVTLGDVAGLIAEGRLTTGMSTRDVCTIPIGIGPESPIIESIKKMVSKNIRRLFVEGQRGRFISDRTLIEYMFSPERLEKARDRPETWIDEEVAKVPTKTPSKCRSSDLDDAARDLGPSPDDCLMTEDWRLVSRWDLTVKPWRARKLVNA